ncbi:MAG: nucleoside transporter C-terminal domain-containing protein [Bacteroidota bacterium]|nr:nucleoside transporter C-terminal domain-containing protein [Bacteroidota bacterium]
MTGFLYSLLRGIIGLVSILGIAFIFSNNKKKIDWKLVSWGIGLQVIFAVLILRGDDLRKIFFPFGWFKDLFNGISYFFVLILNFTNEGAKFVFGNLAASEGTPGFFGVFFAFQVLPSIIFLASFVSVLYYFGIMQKIVEGMAWVMSKLMGTSGAETISVSGDVFLGQTEAPLLVRPFIKDMTNSELLTIMIGGMGTIAVGVMIAYIQILSFSYAKTAGIPLQQAQLFFANHLLSASIMAAPASLLIAKILYPETEEPLTKGKVKTNLEKKEINVIEAAANGAADGLHLALNVAAMLIAFIALIALLNYLLQTIGYFTGLQKLAGAPISMQYIFGSIFRYVAFAIGVSWNDSFNIGSLFGTKLVLNEFVAYLDLGKNIAAKSLMENKSILIATYALCGFANFSSIAIQIGGTGAMAPNRKSDIARMGLKAVLGGTLANLLTAALAGILFN